MERMCPDCKGRDFVEDHAAGDIVCKGCGLVVEERIIDERSEWRTFGDKEKEGGDDPNRVGAATNALFADGGLSTNIGRVAGEGGGGPGGGGGPSSALVRLHNRQNLTDRTLQGAVRAIAAIADRLGLVDSVKRSASEVFKNVHDSKAIRGRSYQSIYAACLYVACRQESMPRTFKEICAVLPEASKKDIGRCFNAIDRMYKAQKLKAAETRAAAAAAAASAAPGPLDGLAASAAGGGAVAAAGAAPISVTGPSGRSAGGTAIGGKAMNAVDVMRRFMSNLGFDNPAAMAAQRTAAAAAELGEAQATPWSGKNPATVASIIIFAINVLNKAARDPSAQLLSLEDVAGVTGMAPATIREGFKDMLPYFPRLVPENFARGEQLGALDGALAAEEEVRAAAKARARAVAAAGGGGAGGVGGRAAAGGARA